MKNRISIEYQGKKTTYDKLLYDLAWFLVWVMGVIFGAVIF